LTGFANTKKGGGSTFGVLTSVTIKAFPSFKFATATFIIGTPPGNEAYWDVLSSIFSRFPELDDQGTSCYLFSQTNFTNSKLNITSSMDVGYGMLMLPFLNTSVSSGYMVETLKNVLDEATATFPGQILT
jgi:hypothetical protein